MGSKLQTAWVHGGYAIATVREFGKPVLKALP
jgi:hypothetical protein